MCESIFGRYLIISRIDKQNFFLNFIINNRRPFYRFLKDLVLYEVLNKYNLLQHLRTCFEKSRFPGRNEWKSEVKQAIRHHQTEEWRTRTQDEPDFRIFRILNSSITLISILKSN